MMRLLAWFIIVLGIVTFCQAELTTSSPTDEVLDRLHEVGKDPKTFTGQTLTRLQDVLITASL